MTAPPPVPARPLAARGAGVLGLALLVLAALGACAPRLADAQLLLRPELEWRTVRTTHFDVHYPRPAEAWALFVARRLDAIRELVRAEVGFAPDERVTVLIEDPTNESNGFALPFGRAPVIFLWPTPVEPPSPLANNRGWWNVLAIHEFAHVAHLTRPSRNPLQRQLWRLLPVELGPIARRAPRWVTEGYATVVEGALTGSGRPNSVGRAAVLRQWAIEGELPSYAALDAGGGYYRGSMAYLMGSAFLEWLDRTAPVAVVGDSAPTLAANRFPLLWRRLTARADRGFAEAFRGVYGEAPSELYGTFTAEITARAIAIRDSLRDAGVREGELVERREYYTGAPAISPSGEQVAIVLPAPGRFSRLVVWPREAPSRDSAVAAARARLLERDPEDVPAVQRFPTPRRPLATLPALDGRAPEQPRWMPDGERILFVRDEPRGDGTTRPDLFLWRWRTGAVERVTDGAGIRQADPTPDGRAAVGTRCEWGICDLVRVELATGAVTVLLRGSPELVYAGPRVGADGRIAVAVQSAGAWRVVVIAPDGTVAEVPAPPDETRGGAAPASRYGPAWIPGANALVVTSEAGGIAHLERVDLATGASFPLTRTTGAHFEPAVAPSGDEAWFLALTADGYDVRRVSLVAGATAFGPALGAAFGGDSLLVPAVVPRLGRLAALRVDTVSPRPYAGRQRLTILPAGGWAADGGLFALAVTGADPIGRLAWTLEGGIGSRSAWRGGALTAEWRAWPVRVTGSVFATRTEPSRQDAGVPALAASLPVPLPEPVSANTLDAALAGANAAAWWRRDAGLDGAELALGAALGTFDPLAAAARERRGLAHGALRLTNGWAVGQRVLGQTLRLAGATGRTGDRSWSRGTASGTLSAAVGGRSLAVAAVLGATTSDAPLFERFAVGGMSPRFVPDGVLAQRVPLPAFPAGTRVGDRLFLWRATATLGLPFGLAPYYTSVSTDRGFDQWTRVAGLEARFATESVPFVPIPAAELRAGWGHRLTSPAEGRDQFYLTLTYAP